MLPVQRKSAIIEHLANEGGCTIKQLSQVLNVSEMTVRRDLKQLESSGNVILSHGGAILAPDYVKEPQATDKESRNKDISRNGWLLMPLSISFMRETCSFSGVGRLWLAWPRICIRSPN